VVISVRVVVILMQGHMRSKAGFRLDSEGQGARHTVKPITWSNIVHIGERVQLDADSYFIQHFL
jgi:hypothetical protein